VCGQTPAEGLDYSREIRRGARTGLVELIRTLVDQGPGLVSALDVKEVKLLARNAAHQPCIFFREPFGYIHRQSTPGCNPRLFLETPMRRQSVNTQGVFLEESRDQHVPKWIHDRFDAVLVSDSV